MISIEWNPSERQLRQFAGIWFPAFWLIVGLLIGLRTGAWGVAFALWGAALAIGAVGVIWPRALRPLFVAWMCAAFPIGWLVSHVLLAAVFYLALTPLGIIARLLGRDKLKLKLDQSAASYWERRSGPP